MVNELTIEPGYLRRLISKLDFVHYAAKQSASAMRTMRSGGRIRRRLAIFCRIPGQPTISPPAWKS